MFIYSIGLYYLLACARVRDEMEDINGIDEEKLNDYQRRTYEVAEKLIQAFTWHDVPPGYDYWKQVYDNLLKHVKADIAAHKGFRVR